jgi:hypothetical protein
LIIKYVLIFSLALVVVEFLAIFVIFHKIKVAKHIWEPRCHLAAEIGNQFPLIIWRECIVLLHTNVMAFPIEV